MIKTIFIISIKVSIEIFIEIIVIKPFIFTAKFIVLVVERGRPRLLLFTIMHFFTNEFH